MENTYKKSLRQLFIDQKRCDVTFFCKNDDDKWEKVGAHKFWLSLISDVFETMFYGECAKGSAVKDGQDIEIQDIGIDSFKLFLGYLYGAYSEMSFDNASHLANLYCAAHKYNCKDALAFAEQSMKVKLCPKNCTIFYNIACLYDIAILKADCKKILIYQTDEVLRSSEFLSAAPEIVNFIFGLSKCAISAELEFVWALERYVNFNSDTDPDIDEKVRAALQSIRFLTLSAVDISRTFLLTQTEKNAIIDSLPPNGIAAKMPAPFCKKYKERSLMKKIDMILALKDLYVLGKCCACAKVRNKKHNHAFWSCPFTKNQKLVEIFVKYQHTNLIDYDLDDLENVYMIYRKNGYIID